MSASRKTHHVSLVTQSKPKRDQRRNRTKAKGSGTARVRGVRDPKPKQRFRAKAVKNTRGKK